MSEPTLNSPIDVNVDACVGFCDPPLQELIRWMHLSPVDSVLAVESCDPSDNQVIPTWLQMVKYQFLGAYPSSGGTRFVARKTH